MRPDLLGALAALAALSVGNPREGSAQHDHGPPADSIGADLVALSASRMGSGTAWLPDAARVPAYHGALGRWRLMAHGSVFLQYARHFGVRAVHQLGSVNWAMGIELRSGGAWSTAFVWGANMPAATRRPRHALLIESTVELRDGHAIFGRAEYVQRTSEELALIGSVPSELDIGALALGYVRSFGRVGAFGPGLGARATVNVIPEELRPFYGSRTPIGVIVYLQVRPR